MNMFKRERGFTLVTGLIFILVASLAAVMLMRGSIMQEQMTSNMNNNSLSFMAAEAGANALREKLGAAWPANGDDLSSWLTTNGLPKTKSGTISANVGSRGYYWVDSASMQWIGTGSERLVAEVTGHSVQDSSILGSTTIRVEFARASLNLPAALSLPGQVVSFSSGNSNNFAISGGTAAAIATQNSSSNDRVLGGIPSNRLENYSSDSCPAPCVQVMDFGSPWNDANLLMAAVNGLRGNDNVTYHEGDWSGSLSGSSSDVTIVRGDLTLRGTNGTYNGVIIVLGGSFEIKGGGNTDIAGGIFVANVVAGENGYEFGNSSTDVSGGGGMSINHDGSAGSSALLPVVVSWNEKI